MGSLSPGKQKLPLLSGPTGTLSHWGSVQREEGPPLLLALSWREVQPHPGRPPGLHLLHIHSRQLISFLYSTEFTVYTISAKLFRTLRQQIIIAPNKHSEGPIALQFHTKLSLRTLDWNQVQLAISRKISNVLSLKAEQENGFYEIQ